MRDNRIPGPEIPGYVAPQVDPDSEKHSFAYHISFFNRSAEPSHRNTVLDHAEDLYAPVKWAVPVDWDSDSRIAAKIESLNKSSSPGYPLCLHCPTNGQLIEKFGGEWLQAQVRARLDAIVAG